MEQDMTATSAPIEIQSNQLELSFWQLRQLLNECKEAGHSPISDIQLLTLVAQIAELTKANGLVFFAQHENLFDPKSSDILTLIHEMWALLERQVKKTQQCLSKAQIVCCLQFMKSLCTIQRNHSKHGKEVTSQKDRTNITWLATKHVSIEILCHLYCFFLEYKSINKNFHVNSDTASLAQQVSSIVFQRLLTDVNSAFSEETHLIHYGKFKYECKAADIAGQDLKTIGKEILFKVVHKSKDLDQEETGFKQELVKRLFYILSVRTQDDYDFAVQICLAYSQTDQAMLQQMKETKMVQRIITMLFQTKQKALALSILNHPQMSKPIVAFFGCERGSEDESQLQNALLFRIARQLCSIKTTQQMQSDVEMSAFDDYEPEVQLVISVSEEPLQREIILDPQVQSVIVRQISDFHNLRVSSRSPDAERLEVFKGMIRGLISTSIQKPLEQNGVVILDLFIYANLRYSMMSQQSWLLDAQHPQNLSTYIEYLKELLKLLDHKIVCLQSGRLVEVTRNYKTKLIMDVMEKLHFHQPLEDESILAFGQRVTDSQIVQSMLPVILARNGDGRYQEQNDCLFLALIRLVTRILDNAPNLISQYLKNGEQESVIKSIIASLSKRLPQAYTFDKDTLSVLIDFFSIILRVADGKKYLENSDLIKLAIQDKLNPKRQFFLGDLVYPQSNVSAQAVLQFQKDLPKSMQAIYENFNSSIMQLETLAQKLSKVYIQVMQNSGSESLAIKLLRSDVSSHNFRVRSLFLINITDTSAFTFTRTTQKLVQILIQAQSSRKIMGLFNTIALLPAQFTTETRVFDLIRPMITDENVSGGESATTIFFENVKASIMNLNSYTNTTFARLESIDDLTSEQNVSTTSDCIPGIQRSTIQGRKLELKLRLRLVLHYTNTLKTLSENIFKRTGSYDFSKEITVLSQLFQLFDRKYYELLNEVFMNETPLSKEIFSRHASKIIDLRTAISYDIGQQKKWNDTLSVIGNSVANYIKEEYGDASEDRYLLKFLIETCTTENFSHAVAASDQETMRLNLRSIGEMCAHFANQLKHLTAADGLEAVHYNASLLESLNFVFVMELKMVNGSLLMAFWKNGGIAPLCRFYLNMVELQESLMNGEQKPTDIAQALLRLSVLKQREIAALILTNLLNCPKDYKSNFALLSYKRINYETECGPDLKLENMKHFFFNFYNQFMQNLQTDLLQQRGQIQDTVFETLTGLLADQFTNIIDAASLERLPRERDRESMLMLGRQNRMPHREAPQVERDPTAEEIAPLESMGYNSYLAEAALRMTGHNRERAADLLLGHQSEILAFIDQRNAKKEAEQKLLEEQELALALKMSEGNIDDEVKEVKIISIEDFMAIVKEKIPGLIKTLLQANETTLITSSKAIQLVKKLAPQLKEDSFELWQQLRESFKVMAQQIQSQPQQLCNLKQHLEVYVTLLNLSKNQPGLDKALLLNDVIAAGTAILKCLDSPIAQQCLYLLQETLCSLQNIPDYYDATANDYLLQLLSNPDVIRPTLDLTLIIACKRAGLVGDYSERQGLAYKYVTTLRKQTASSKSSDFLSSCLINYAAFGDQQASQVCDKVIQGSFVTVARLRETLLTENKKQVPRVESGELDKVLTKYKLHDLLEQLQKVTSNEQVLLAKINEQCEVIGSNGEYLVQFNQQLFNQAQKEASFDERHNEANVEQAYLNQLKLASNLQTQTFEEILGFIKENVDYRLDTIGKFGKGIVSADEQARVSSQASESLLHIFKCVCDLIQLTPNLIAVVIELVRERPFATWLVEDFFPSVSVNFEKVNESFLLKCKSLNIEALIQSLTCIDSFKTQEEQVLAHDLRSRILQAAIKSLKINKSCQDNLGKMRVVAALTVVRTCIQMRGRCNKESTRSTLEMLQTTFIADLQECFIKETQLFSLSQKPQDNLRNSMIELAIDCLEVLCQQIETLNYRKHQAKKTLQAQPAAELNQIAGSVQDAEMGQAEQMMQNIVQDLQQVNELNDPDQQNDDESSSEQMDEDAPEENDEEYGEQDPEENAGDDEIDDENEVHVPEMALDDFDMNDDSDQVEDMLDFMVASGSNELSLQVGGNRIPVSQFDNLSQQASELLALLSGTNRQHVQPIETAKPDSIFDCIQPPTKQHMKAHHTMIYKAYVDYKQKNSQAVKQQITFIETRSFKYSSASVDTEEHFMMQMMMRRGRLQDMPHELAARYMQRSMEEMRQAVRAGAPLNAGLQQALFGFGRQNLDFPGPPEHLWMVPPHREEEEDDIRADNFGQIDPPDDQRRQNNQEIAANIIATLNQRGLVTRQQDPELSNEEMKSGSQDNVPVRLPSREVSPRQSQESQSPLIVQGHALVMQPQPEEIQAQAEEEVVQLQIQQPEAPVIEPGVVAEQVAEPLPVEPLAEEMKEEEPMTFGFPNSVLVAHGIEPSILEQLPEEIRVELLSSVQWQPAAANNNANANNDPNEVDQEFLMALPIELRQELEAERAARNRQQAQPMVEDSLATFIATIIDPRVRAETLAGLTPEQVATLPPGLRAEAVAVNQRQAEQRAREQQRIEAMMRQQQERQIRGPPRQGGLGQFFGMRDLDEIDEIQARYLQDKNKQIESEFKSNPEKLITPNQAYTLLEKIRPYVPKEELTLQIGTQVEIQIAANQTTVQSILSLLFKTTIEEEKVDDVVARFCGRLIPLLSNMMQIKSNSSYLNRIKITNCLTSLVAEQLAEEDFLLQSLASQLQEQKLKTKAPVVIFIVVKLLSQMNRHFVAHLLQQFLFKDCDFAKNSLQVCLPVQTKKPERPLLIEILSYLNINKGNKTDPTVHNVLHHIMLLVFGNFDLVIEEVVGSHKPQIGAQQIEIIIEALKLQATSKKLLASFANVLMHIAGNNQELWLAINKKCYQDAVSVLSQINQTFEAVDCAFGNYKPQSILKTESEMFKELTLQRGESQSQELILVKPKSLMKGEEQSLQHMLKDSGDALCVLRNFLFLFQNMTLAEDDERSKLIRSTQLEFSESKEQSTYLERLSEVLQIVQATKSDQNLMVYLTPNVICAFELYLPEIIATRKSQEGEASGDKSCVKMLPVVSGERVSSNVFGVLGSISDRLRNFNRFCLQNKRTINKLISAKNTDPELNKLVALVPSIVEFENKKEHFKREMAKLNQENRVHQIPITIKRAEIFHDAYRQLNHLSAKELRGKLHVKFVGEEGMDAGGLLRDFFTNLSKSMFKVEYSLFKKADNGVSYCCEEQSDINPDHLAFFKFVGRMVGKAVCDKQLLDCYFTKSVYKCMLGQALSFDDLFDQDNQLYKTLKWVIENNVDDACLGSVFAVEQQFFGRSEKKNLIPDGENVAVTEQNKYQYVEKYAFFKMYTQVKNQMDAFLKGFHELMPLHLIQIFTHKELEMLISGLPNFDLDDLKKNTIYDGYNPSSQVVIWLFEILQDFSKEQIGLFLMFVTGSSKIPLEGFCALQGRDNMLKQFEILRNPTKNLEMLPSSHTCFNQIELPEYPSKEILQSKLEIAITACSGFGFV